MPLVIKFFYTCVGRWGLMLENHRLIAYIRTDLLFLQIVVEGTSCIPCLPLSIPHPQNEAFMGHFD